MPSARSLRRRSVLVTERARPTHAKWYAYCGVYFRSKYKPGVTVVVYPYIEFVNRSVNNLSNSEYC